MSTSDDMPNSIEVVKCDTGFYVYGRFGSILRTDHEKHIIYCNLRPGATERVDMELALETYIETIG